MTDTQNGQTEGEPDGQQIMPKVDLRKARFSIETIHGTTFDDIRLMPGDVVGAERQYGMRASEIEAGATLESLLYMVWLASTRKGYPGDFEVFLTELVDFSVESGAETGNPTQPAQ